jgi:hypothetical protein
LLEFTSLTNQGRILQIIISVELFHSHRRILEIHWIVFLSVLGMSWLWTYHDVQYGQRHTVINHRDTDRHIDLFILKNMGAAAIIDFRVCPPLVKCQHFMFLGFIDTLMYGFSSTGVTIYCYFGLKFNDNTCCEVICQRRYNDNDLMTTNKLPGMYFSFLITVIFPIQNQYKPTW